MGRKIISKKHKGVKDPIKQQQRKYEKIKNKINNPPENPNVQEGPKKFQGFDSQSLKEKPKKRRKKTHLIDTARFVDKNVGFYPHNGRPFKPVPTLQQNPNESNYHFMKRVREATQMVLKESKFQDKYKVNVERDEVGQVASVQPWITKELEEKRERKRLKRKERDLKKKLKKKRLNPSRVMGGLASKNENDDDDDEDDKDDEDDFDQKEKELFRKEDFAFGETVHQPPKLETKKLQKKVNEEKKMKIKNFLFLQNLKGEESSANEVKNSKAREKILEIEREKAVFAYRQLKASKMDSTLR